MPAATRRPPRWRAGRRGQGHAALAPILSGEGLLGRAPASPGNRRRRGRLVQGERPPQIRGTGYVVQSLEAALWALTAPRRSGKPSRGRQPGRRCRYHRAVCGQLAGAFYGAEVCRRNGVMCSVQRERFMNTPKASYLGRAGMRGSSPRESPSEAFHQVDTRTALGFVFAMSTVTRDRKCDRQTLAKRASAIGSLVRPDRGRAEGETRGMSARNSPRPETKGRFEAQATVPTPKRNPLQPRMDTRWKERLRHEPGKDLVMQSQLLKLKTGSACNVEEVIKPIDFQMFS